jgi:hypothetical protein
MWEDNIKMDCAGVDWERRGMECCVAGRRPAAKNKTGNMLFYLKGPTNELGFMNAVLSRANHRHVSAIDVAIFRVMTIRTRVLFIILKNLTDFSYNPVFKY